MTASVTPQSTPPRAAGNGSPQNPLDLLCVGIGPFGLGLACLADPLERLSVAFLDRAPEFDWHPGLLFDRATLQVPFLADLVTMADPTSRFTFLAWLKETGRLYPFYVRESFYPLRREYNDYCRWAAERVRGLHWGHDVVAVSRERGSGPWRVTSEGPHGTTTWWTRHLVIGTGTSAVVPRELHATGRATVHAGEYLHQREQLIAQDHVTVVGSGQSAAEVVLDLVTTDHGPAVDWITRSPRFYPMEYSKLSLELTSPEYLDHFRSLPEPVRDALNASQPQLHRGISDDTINELHEALYVRRTTDSQAPVRLLAATELVGSRVMDGRVLLNWRSVDSGHERETFTDAVVAATGYAPAAVPWLEPVREQLSVDSAGRVEPDRYHGASADGTVHVLNHGEHTHALTAPDLGMGPLRNAHILNRVTGQDQYRTENRTTFQSFGRLPQARSVPCLEGAPGAVGRGNQLRFTTECHGRTFMFRQVEPQGDLSVLHAWLTQPRAAAWHLVDAPPEAVAREYRRMRDEPSETAWLVQENGRPVALVETYDPACSPLAGVFTVRDGDAGLHLFLAPTSQPVSGTSAAVMAAALELLWADLRVQRVLVEPDVNHRAVRDLNVRAGFRELTEVQLPDKTACLSVLERPARHADSARDADRGEEVAGEECADPAGHLTPTPGLTPDTTDGLHRAVLAKLFSEFIHERMLTPRPDGSGWSVPGDDAGVHWWFRASRHPLEHWEIDPASITRLPEGGLMDPQQAVLDLRDTLDVTDAVLPLYLEDLSATMLTMARRRAARAPSARELAHSPLPEVERHLDRGHPGFVASSGRVGMGAHELAAWSPEAEAPAPLVWLAARTSRCTLSLSRELSERDHLDLHLLPGERERFDRAVCAAGQEPEEFTPLPVHPWQWEHRILPGMLPDVLRHDLILVGPSDHRWRAQQSLRTFLDVDDPTRDYAKTALGVHSMGFLRGLSPAYMRTMPAISDWLHDTVTDDPFLRASGIRVLRERSSVGWTGDAHHRSGVASEHTKQLAALWRESPVPLLEAEEHAASLAGVLHVDRGGDTLIGAWIERSGASARDWVRALLAVYLVPVSHLLLVHDIALMPHGENVILRLRHGLPVGAFWKDIGEEIAVLSNRPVPEGLERIRTVVPPEMRELSIHTDVLDGVLRHLAVLMDTHGLLPEDEFWGLAADCLDDHRERFPAHWTELDLFREDFAHSCLNRLQLRNPQHMVDLTDPAGSLALAGRLANPLASHRAHGAGGSR